MPTLTIRLEGLVKQSLSQLDYALTFASEDIVAAQIRDSTIVAELKPGSDKEAVAAKLDALIRRYSQPDVCERQTVHFKQERDLSPIDAWAGLLERRWVTPVGKGQVILRGPAAQLLRAIDARVERFARHFHAEFEVYPPTISNHTLDRCAHFTSFPEHMDFVAHLKQDLDVLNGFTKDCRENGWSASLHDGRMDGSEISISPSCCYHCYEGMEGWDLPPEGRCVTATLACHRYEGANHRSLSRLRAFTMREVIFVGQPRYVIKARAQAEELMIQWARDWDLACSFETANDMFFTEDYSIKASFQRLHEAKKELRLELPGEKQSLSVFSSNFHATTFGKAFNINVNGRPATSGCLGWGYERWIYAIVSQFGFDVARWPEQLRCEYELQQSQVRS